MSHPLQHLVKTKSEIEKMREAGKLAASVLTMIEPFVKEGVSTEKLNNMCHEYIINDLGAIPAPLNYKGFPKTDLLQFITEEGMKVSIRPSGTEPLIRLMVESEEPSLSENLCNSLAELALKI